MYDCRACNNPIIGLIYGDTLFIVCCTPETNWLSLALPHPPH